MKSLKSLKRPALLSAMTLVAAAAMPAMAQDSGWYVGVGAGWPNAKIDAGSVSEDLLGLGLTTTGFVSDEGDSGFKVYTGYEFNKYFAIEGGYFDLGNFDFFATTQPAGTLSESLSVQGLNLDLRLSLPIGERFSVFGSAGANYAETKMTLAGSGAIVVADTRRKERKVDYKYGGGFQFEFTESFLMRMEAERFRIDDTVGIGGDVDFYSIGMLYRFGRQTLAAAPVAAPPPAPVPPPPPPPPPQPVDSDQDGVFDDRDKCPGTPRGTAVDADGCPLKGSITLEGVNFEFNSALLTAESRTILGTMASDLKKYPRLRIELQGHTDNVGSDAYNQALSQRRAESVRAYLVEHGVPAGQFTARGYGESQPIDDNRTDAGRARNRRVVMNVIANPGEVEIEGEGTVEK